MKIKSRHHMITDISDKYLSHRSISYSIWTSLVELGGIDESPVGIVMNLLTYTIIKKIEDIK